MIPFFWLVALGLIAGGMWLIVNEALSIFGLAERDASLVYWLTLKLPMPDSSVWVTASIAVGVAAVLIGIGVYILREIRRGP